MACGAPVIATDCPVGPSEIIKDGKDGLIVPVDEPDAIASRIEYLLDNPEERQALGLNAQKSAERFGVEASLARYESALLGNEPRSGLTANSVG